MTFDLTEQMRHLMKTEVDNDEWDGMPMLFVYQANTDPENDDPFALTIMALAADGMHPVDMLQNIALNVVHRGSTPLEFEGELLGLIFFCEGWGLATSSTLTQEEIQAWSDSGKRFVDHPDARENKMLTGVQNLGSGPVIQLDVQYMDWVRHEEPKTEPLQGFEGRVPDSLKGLFIALHEVLRGQS